MRTMLLTAALLAPSVALAHPSDAVLTIDNRFDGAVEVFVDQEVTEAAGGQDADALLAAVVGYALRHY